MADEEAPGTSQEATQQTTEQPEPTLDDVYKEAGALAQPEPQRQDPQPVVQQQVQKTVQQPVQPHVPDPYDTDAHKAYLANLAAGQTTLQHGLAAVAQFISTQQHERAQAQMKSDISQAVGVMQETVPDANPKVLEAFLDGKAREDTRFKSLWDNRGKNPEAWSKAVKAYSREVASQMSVKVDPKLQEAQRARKLAQGAMATTAAQEPDDKWNGMADDKFGQEWERLISGGAN